MRNRALLLALKNKIYSKEEFAELVDISLEQCELLFLEQPGVTPETVDKCCLYFNVSIPYFLCACE